MDYCKIFIVQDVIHPETRQPVARVGDLLVNRVTVLRDIGADYVMTNLGIFNL